MRQRYFYGKYVFDPFPNFIVLFRYDIQLIFSVNAAPTSDCYQHQAMIVTKLNGIFSSVLTKHDNVGSLECPWRIQAPEGKYVRVVM